MKRSIAAIACLASLAFSSLAHAFNPGDIDAFYVDEYQTTQGLMSLSTVLSHLTQALAPAEADGTFLCNNSGGMASPVPCSIGSGLTLSGGTLSANGYSFTLASPTSRTVSLSTAYQATSSSKPASVTINITSTASLSISGGTTNTATVYIGSTSGVASGTGTAICQYSNSNTGTLTIGLNMSTVSAVPCSFVLPSGWYFAVLQSAGSVTINSAFDQSLG